MTLHLITLDAYHLASGHVHRWRLCTTPGYQSRPDDDPASLPWLPIVARPPDIAVSITRTGATIGPTRLSVGGMTLANTRNGPGEGPGGRDWPVYDVTAGAWTTVALPARPSNVFLTDYALAGWPIIEHVVAPGAALTSAGLVFRGVMEMPRAVQRHLVEVSVRSPEAPYGEPAQVDAYTDADGETLAGKTRERTYGTCVVPPTYLGVIDGLHTYSVNGGQPIQAADIFWSRGVRYTPVPWTTTPTIGQYRVDLTTGRIQVGGGQVESPAVHVEGDATGGYVSTLGAVARRLVEQSGVALSAAIDTAAAAALDTATPRTVGLHLPAGSSLTVAAALDSLMGSIARGGWLVGEDGRLWVGRLPSSGDPAATYRQGVNAAGLTPRASAADVPAKRVTLRWGAVPVPADVATAATEADALLFASAWRAVDLTNDTVAAAYPGGRTVEMDTVLQDGLSAAQEAALVLADLSVSRPVYDLPVTDTAPGIGRAAIVHVVDDIAGFETGADVLVIGRETNRRAGRATLVVRGI